ncbi:MAG: hypothetical protein AB1752_07940 [Candidatus Zixiibacteriota bacterium]
MRIKLVILGIVIVAFGVFAFKYYTGTTSESLAINQDQFVKAYVELAILAETMPIGTPEYEREKERVLGKLGLEPSQVEAALAKFNDRPDLWHPVWEKIQTELDKREGSSAPVIRQTDSSGQTSH